MGWDGLEISDLLELCAEPRDHQIIYAAQGSRGIHVPNFGLT